MGQNAFTDLLNRVRRGDSEAAGLLMEQYEDAIRREIRFSLVDWRMRRLADESDICQSVMMRFLVQVWAGNFDLQNPADLVNLLKSMVRSRVADLHRYCTAQRRDVRRTEPVQNDGLAAKNLGPELTVANADFLQEFEKRLDEPHRSVLRMRREGLSWARIAEQSGESADRAEAVRKRFERAVARVSANMGIEA